MASPSIRIETLPFGNTNLANRVREVIRGLTTAARAAQQAFKLQTTARTAQPADIHNQARQMVNRIVADGLASRSAPVSPREHALGFWKPFDQFHQVDPATQAAMRSRDARYARTTSGAGIETTAFAPYPEITLPWINYCHRRAYVNGWVDRKCDIDHRYLQNDSHLKGIHGIRKSVTFKAPFKIRPRSSTPLGLLTASAVRAAWGHVSGFRSSMGELGVQACTGFSSAELVWKPVRLSIPVGKNRIAVDSEVISSLEQVYPRNFAFDITNDRPYLCLGPQDYIDVVEPGLQKFLFIKADGEGPTRHRGYGWANAPLSYLGGLSLERFGIVIETYGVSTPYLSRDQEGYLTDEEHAHAISILENLGTGGPEVIPARYGKLDFSPVPSGLAPLHASLLGLVKGEQSKLVLSSTLQMETDGIGSNALGTVHQDQQTDVQRVDCGLYGEAITDQPFKYICEANAEQWAKAFSRYVPGGCTPWDVIAECPIAEWVISNESPSQRLAVFQGVKGLGFEVDEEQVREETGVRAPIPDMFAGLANGGEPGDFTITDDGPSDGGALDGPGVSDSGPDEDTIRLAAEMTQYGLERCAHDMPNRCRICGVERVRGVVPGVNGEPPTWRLAWKAIGAKATSEPAAAPEPPAAPAFTVEAAP